LQFSALVWLVKMTCTLAGFRPLSIKSKSARLKFPLGFVYMNLTTFKPLLLTFLNLTWEATLLSVYHQEEKERKKKKGAFLVTFRDIREDKSDFPK